jgi:putative tryptophan/tyrosine transport system substrate-binding protein
LAAEALGVKLLPVEVRRLDDFEGAFATIVSGRSEALLVSSDAIMFGAQEALVTLAARDKIPAVYPIREFAAGGGLVSYGTNYSAAYEEVGDYLDRVLSGGEKPNDLPVRQVTKLELVINMKTAKALGLTIPTTLLNRADVRVALAQGRLALPCRRPLILGLDWPERKPTREGKK